MNTYIRFGHGRDGIVGPTYGPYDFVQITYGLIRAWREGEDETELAFHHQDDDWHLLDAERDETVFSDFVVYSEE